MTRLFRELLKDATRVLESVGIEDARREARLLAQHAFQLSASDLVLREEEHVPDGDAFSAFEAFLGRRAAREPLQHIQGATEFFGLELLSDTRALIPRPDSEVVVEAALELLPDDFDGVIADLGTGSGCLLLACLSNRPNASGIGIDASGEAVSLAQENAVKTGLAARAEFVQTSWENWDGWVDADLIISNPPYIETAIIETLQLEVRGYDPMSALDGGVDGLAAYQSIFASGASLKIHSPLVLEIGYDQAESVPIVAKKYGFDRVSLKHDIGSNPRALTFQKGLENNTWRAWPMPLLRTQRC